MKFDGQSASTGFGEGKTLWITNPVVGEATVGTFAPRKSEAEEISSLQNALKKAQADINGKLAATSHQTSREVLEAHASMLEDPEVEDQSIELIKAGIKTAREAYSEVIENFKGMLLASEDEYMKQRALDLEDISQRVLHYVQNPDQKFLELQLDKDTVVLSDELTPSQIMALDKNLVRGIATVRGGASSHTAILARSLEIPLVVGLGEELRKVPSGIEVLLNAVQAHLLVDATESEREDFQKQILKSQKQREEQLLWKGKPTLSKDGQALTLAANIAGPQDLPAVLSNDAEAVGLYRTEFLFLERSSAPSEEEQVKIYRQVLSGLSKKPVLIRTLDIGGDKSAPYLQAKPEDNPFLGVRALRLCFQNPQLFKTQLRAILRAAHGAEVGIMFPMVSNLEELLKAREFLKEVEGELRAEKIPFAEKYQVGVMVEIPSLAWMMDILAPHVDFISLGTNDLLQYTTASDRLNGDLKEVHNPLNPGFLRSIHFIVTQARMHGIHVGMCGSLSHHPLLLPFFIGCGVEELSMSAQHILPLRAKIAGLDFKTCATLVEKVLKASTAAEVKAVLS